MLQWMGGSRRKVTTSRKSTYKRQKQYFEQRKKQQQQNTAGLDICSDGKGSSTLQCGKKRSLDILCLENISTLAHKHKSSCTDARYNSQHNDFTSNHQDARPSQVSFPNHGILVDQSEINDEKTSSSYITEDEYSEKVLVHLPDRKEDIAGNHKKLDSFKLSPMNQISVVDLLGDDGGANNNEENSSHTKEAHVSFSVKGLGKVEMETPTHSPEILDRYFPSCYSPQKKTRRQPITAKHLDSNFCDLGSGLDVLLREIDFSSHASSIDQPFGSKDVMNITGNPYQKSKSFRRSSPYNWDGCDLQSTLRNDEITCNIQDRSSNIWNGSSFLNESMDDLGEYESFSKKWVDQRDIGFDDYFNCKDLQKQDLNFEDWDQPKKRSSVKRTEAFNVKGSPVTYSEHRTILNLDVIFSDNMCSSPIGIYMDDKDAIHHMPRVDTTERRLPSEESCSSTAVRGDATRKS